MFIPYNSIVIILGLALCIQLISRNWVFIPALIDMRRYPLAGPNMEVAWLKPNSKIRADTNKRPNIVLIVADDMGFKDLSLYGGHYYGHLKTPNIDSIGRNGITFTNAYAGHATCAPSRAAIMTGRYATKIGFEFTPASPDLSWVLGALMGNGRLSGIYHAEKAEDYPFQKMTLPKSDMTIAEALNTVDYKSIHLGKWHLGYTKDSKAIHRGFNETLGFDIISRYLPYDDPSSVECHFTDPFDRYLWANVRYEVRKDTGRYFRPKGYLTDYLAEEAAKAIHVNKDHPFFMYMAFTSMHTPLQALRSDYEAMHELERRHGYVKGQARMSHCQKVYGAMLLALDRSVGIILQALRESGVEDNTMVIFTNDNGAPQYVTDLNTPLRGGKGTFFEGGIRVPLLMKWPALIKGRTGQPHDEEKGVVLDSIVSHIDMFPTILEAAGVPIPDAQSIDGQSLLPLLKSAIEPDVYSTHSKGHKSLFWRSGHYMAYREGPWKVKSSQRPNKKWLYNLNDDPGEKRNLAEEGEGDHSNTLNAMVEAMERENKTQSEPLWPALSETPVLVDRLFNDYYRRGDEYVYWCN